MSLWIDTHCHLDAGEFDADRSAVAVRAHERGVAAIVLPAVQRSNWTTVATLAGQVQGGCYALGIHPLWAASASDADLDALEQAVDAAMADPRFVAIGEIGLDLFVAEAIAAIDRQEIVLRRQLEIARRHRLPVLLHIRRAQDKVLKHLRAVRVEGGTAHAFNGSRQQAQAFADLGLKLGVGGAMTYPRALRIRDIASFMPIDTLVLETDSPDIAPEWISRGRNEPAEVVRIGETLAALRGIEVEQLREATAANAIAILPRLATALTMEPLR
ncbi:TatD family hydrolase [soil metagenome]